MIVYGDPSAIGPLKRFGAPLKRFGARHSAPRMQSNSERMAGCAVTVNTKGSNKHCTVKMSQSRIVLSVYCLACAWTADSRLRVLWRPIHPYVTLLAVSTILLRFPFNQMPHDHVGALWHWRCLPRLTLVLLCKFLNLVRSGWSPMFLNH